MTGNKHQTQDESFADLESARKYARHAKASLMRRGYVEIVGQIAQLGIKGRFLEIGPGPAILTIMVAHRLPDVHVTGLEISPTMIVVAREEIDNEGLSGRIDVVNGDAGDPDTLDKLGQFDLVYSTFALHHWNNPETTINNLLRAVKPDGTLLIHDLKRVWWLSWIPGGSGFIKSIKAAFVPEEVQAMMKSMGIEDFEVRNGPFYQTILIKA